MKKQIILYFILLSGLAACAPQAPAALTPTRVVEISSPIPTRVIASPTAVMVVQPTVTSTPDTRLPPERWQEWPVVPVVSARMRLVYSAGLGAGRSPDRFSIIGDCQNVGTYYLGMFDTPGNYGLGTEYASLQPTIDQFAGSWSRTSLAVKGGMNVAAVQNPLWADPKSCEKGESPLACELRVFNASIVTVSMETWWSQRPASEYEKYLRQLVEYILLQGVVPILGTKADNLEGNHGLNSAIARVAYDYDVPMWNFWAAVQPLPDHGLTEDGFHLTFAQPFFDDPERMEQAWPWRNLTALQSIDAVYKGLNTKP